MLQIYLKKSNQILSVPMNLGTILKSTDHLQIRGCSTSIFSAFEFAWVMQVKEYPKTVDISLSTMIFANNSGLPVQCDQSNIPHYMKKTPTQNDRHVQTKNPA
jgi:hypothetical protein